MAAFIDRVGDYLDAFVSRREQIREARRAFRSQLTRTDTNAACDALTLALETGTPAPAWVPNRWKGGKGGGGGGLKV